MLGFTATSADSLARASRKNVLWVGIVANVLSRCRRGSSSSVLFVSAVSSQVLQLSSHGTPFIVAMTSRSLLICRSGWLVHSYVAMSFLTMKMAWFAKAAQFSTQHTQHTHTHTHAQRNQWLSSRLIGLCVRLKLIALATWHGSRVIHTLYPLTITRLCLMDGNHK
eukprot:857387-Amphidinium_carterae.1